MFVALANEHLRLAIHMSSTSGDMVYAIGDETSIKANQTDKRL